MMRHCEFLKRDEGQALTEAPFAILLVCLLAFVLLQPALILSTRMAMNYSLAQCARVAITDTSENQNDYLLGIAKSKMGVLPKTALFYIPSSLKLEVEGTSASPDLILRMSLKQKPLPVIGRLMQVDSDGTFSVERKVRVAGAMHGVKSSELMKEIKVGEGWDRD